MILDQEVLMGVLIVGTFLTYLFIPTPNVIYKDQKTKDEILSFESICKNRYKFWQFFDGYSTFFNFLSMNL